MTKQIDFTGDYEGLIGQLYDLVAIIDLALADDTKKTATATLHVLGHSLNHLITYHTTNANRHYQPQEVAHERA